jgi:hypothetical protein
VPSQQDRPQSASPPSSHRVPTSSRLPTAARWVSHTLHLFKITSPPSSPLAAHPTSWPHLTMAPARARDSASLARLLASDHPRSFPRADRPKRPIPALSRQQKTDLRIRSAQHPRLLGAYPTAIGTPRGHLFELESSRHLTCAFALSKYTRSPH